MFTFNKKKLTKKVKSMIRSDVFGSLAIASILLNLFFLTGVVLFKGTNALDLSVYKVGETNLCEKNYETNLVEEMEKSTAPDKAKVYFEINCKSGDFSRYYSNAVQAYVEDKL